MLEERDDAYRFIHLAFQEFLVARYLREVTGGEGREAILAFVGDRLDDPWWREPILLLAGYWAAQSPKPARDFLGALTKAGAASNARFCAAELAGVAALEWRESGEAVRGDCARRIVELLDDTDALADSSPVVRARAGNALARLGDPRFDPQRFYLPADDALGFVHIDADPDFRIGTREADRQRVAEIIGHDTSDKEINDVPTPSPEFYIARYPVTVAQFKAFVEATQYEFGDADALRDPDSRPVRYVSWREAIAYCEWLKDLLATSSAFDGNPIACLVREQGWRVEPAQRAGVGEGSPRRAWRRRLLVGRHTGRESGQLFRLGDQRHVGGRLFPRQWVRSARHDRQRVGVDAQPLRAVPLSGG